MTTRTEMQIEIAEAFMSLLKTSLAIDHLADVGDDVSMERMIDVYTEQEMAAFALAAKYGWDWEQDDDWVPEHMTGTEIAHYGLSRAMEKCKVPCCDRERNPDPAGSKDVDEMHSALESLGFEHNPQTGGGCSAFIAEEGECTDYEKVQRLLASKGAPLLPATSFQLWITREGDASIPQTTTEPVEFRVWSEGGQEVFAYVITTVGEILTA